MPVAMPIRDLQRLLGAGFDFRDRSDDFQPCSDRPLSVVLMRTREAEIDQHPIAHELGDEAVVARDRARTSVMIDPDNFAHVFRIKPRRQRGRADEIAKHHCR